MSRKCLCEWQWIALLLLLLPLLMYVVCFDMLWLSTSFGPIAFKSSPAFFSFCRIECTRCPQGIGILPFAVLVDVMCIFAVSYITMHRRLQRMDICTVTFMPVSYPGQVEVNDSRYSAGASDSPPRSNVETHTVCVLLKGMSVMYDNAEKSWLLTSWIEAQRLSNSKTNCLNGRASVGPQISSPENLIHLLRIRCFDLQQSQRYWMLWYVHEAIVFALPHGKTSHPEAACVVVNKPWRYRLYCTCLAVILK